MSVELVDVSKLREHAERQSKLDRAIQSQEISKTAKLESQGPFTGLLKTTHLAPTQPQPKQYVYTEYLDGVHSMLCKVADHKCSDGKGELEKELQTSNDVRHGLQDLLGGGITNPYLVIVGATSSICMRHMTLKKMGVNAGQKNNAAKPNPKKAQQE